METIISHRSISTHATRGSQARSLAPYVTYPLVLAANAALVTWALWTGASLESVTAAARQAERRLEGLASVAHAGSVQIQPPPSTSSRASCTARRQERRPCPTEVPCLI